MSWKALLGVGAVLFLACGLLTFAQTDAEEVTVLPFGAEGYRFLVVSLDEAPEDYFLPEFDDFDFDEGQGPFGTHGECVEGFVTSWTGVSELILRKEFYVEPGLSNFQIILEIDNDIQVHVNGADVSGGVWSTEGCWTENVGTIAVPEGIILPGDNLIAVRARNRHGPAGVSLEILAQIGGPEDDVWDGSMGRR